MLRFFLHKPASYFFFFFTTFFFLAVFFATFFFAMAIHLLRPIRAHSRGELADLLPSTENASRVLRSGRRASPPHESIIVAGTARSSFPLHLKEQCAH